MVNYKCAEERWKGKLGDEYLDRNNIFSDRADFWIDFQEKYKYEKYLEVGCGDGKNLYYLSNKVLGYGIDINFLSIMDLFNVCIGSATDIPFKDNYFDLVFTCGLLIHIPPDGILKAMKEIVRCSRRYILAIEYWSEKERERPFLGEMGITFKRPYDGLFLNNFNVRLLEQGFLTKKEGFNDLQYFMFEKEK